MNTSIRKTESWVPPTPPHALKKRPRNFTHQASNRRLPEFHFDVNVTSKCNLACTYCSEGESCGLSTIFQAPTNLLPDELVKKVLELDKTKYSAVNLYFWGGEAFTNWPFCKAVMNKLANVKYINFMFYTNGVYLKK